MLKPLLIFGCGGHSRSVADIYLKENSKSSLLFIDEHGASGETLFGFPVLKEYPQGNYSCFFALGDNIKRFSYFQKMGSAHLVSILSSKACYGRESCLEKGCFVGNFCHIGPQVKVGYNTILNNGSIIEHEVQIGSHSHVAPRAVISGRCKIGDFVFIGVGAVVRDGIEICSHVIVGAGGVVVKSIQEPGIYVGCPVKKIRE